LSAEDFFETLSLLFKLVEFRFRKRQVVKATYGRRGGDADDAVRIAVGQRF
jgi:hypothetical protein